jgi:hypothetical protein
MGAALHSIDSNQSTAERREHTTVTPFERPTEAVLARAAGQIAYLEATTAHLAAEVRLLRDALARSEHKIRCQEQLLRNAMLRESALRTQMTEGMK